MTEPGDVGHDEDGVLVSRCKKGDMDAFETLVNRHQKRMLNIAYRMSGSYEDACDIVQDAFVAAYRGICRFEERSRFSTWLHTIVVNQTRNYLKKADTRAGRIGLSLDEPIRSEEGGIHLDPASPGPSVLDTLVQREEQARVQQCITALEREFREVLILRDIQGFTYEEISSLLQLAAGTVKSRLYRARESVASCLKKLRGRF